MRQKAVFDMKIGIIVAMEKELRLLLPEIEDLSERQSGMCRLYEGKIGSHEIVAMQCGIGKVNAAVKTLEMIESCKPDLVINTGVAGGADKSMHPLDVVVADSVAYHDVWCGPGTKTGHAAGMPLVMEPDSRVIEICREAGSDSSVRYGLICSGDRFISEAAEVAVIKAAFPEALAVDMESAAIAHVCTLCGVPFAVIRVISDTPGEADNISQYENFWSDAPAETFAILRGIVKAL